MMYILRKTRAISHTNNFQNKIRASFMCHLIWWQRKSLVSTLHCQSYLSRERKEHSALREWLTTASLV